MSESKYISVSYELSIVTEGEAPVLVEQTTAEHPFSFISGLGYTLPDFEANVVGLNKGESFDFTIPQDKAYGPYEEERVKELPKDIFRNSGGHFDADTIYPGNVIPMMNEDGMRFDGLVKDVTDNTVVIDFNHELAGMDLNFRGEIVETHNATPEEISAFVNGMSGGCGGNCGGECDCNHDKCDHEHEHCGCGHCH